MIVALRQLTDAPLRVAPALQAVPLASPAQRLFALAIDVLVVVLPSFAVATGAALLTLRLEDRVAFDALRAIYAHRPDRPAPPDALAAIAPLLVDQHADGLPPEVAVAVRHGDRSRAAALLRDYDFLFTIRIGGNERAPLQPRTIRVEVAEFLPHEVRAIASYGVMALYFGLLTAGRRGQTLGKRLLGIRVVRLDGHRLSLVESLERFVGYLHIPGSLGISILDLWREPNRRMAHDRVAHTVVIRDRRPARSTAPPATRATAATAKESATAPPPAPTPPATPAPTTQPPRVDD